MSKIFKQVKEIKSYDQKMEIFDQPTILLFGALEACFNYFKKSLFSNPISPVILTLTRKSHSTGYYKPSAWTDGSNKTLAEININPDLLLLEPVEIMKVLAYQLCRHYHYSYSKSASGSYNSKEFISILSAIGLAIVEAGQYTILDIVPTGLFASAFAEIPAELILPFRPTCYADDQQVQKVSLKRKENPVQKNKIKYTCLSCSMSVWGKPNLHIICGNCKERLAVIDDFGKSNFKK